MRALVVALGLAPVQGLDERQAAEGELQVAEHAFTGEGREQVVHGGRDALLEEIGEEGVRVPPPALDRLVLPLRDVEHAEVKLPVAGEVKRDLVDGFRLGVAFPAKVAQHGQVRGSRMQGMDLEITAHRRSLPCSSRSSFNQPFNSVYIEGRGDCGKMKARETFGDGLVTAISRRRHGFVGR